jgi:hypothetical protein
MLDLTDRERKLLAAAQQEAGAKAAGGSWFLLVVAAICALMIISALLGRAWPWWSEGAEEPLQLTLNQVGMYLGVALCCVTAYQYNRFAAGAYSLIRKLHGQLGAAAASGGEQSGARH